jgi:DNA polymerase (family 10)
MNNQELARIFGEMALYMEMEGGMVFKIRAYENAANAIGSMSEDVGDIYRKAGVKGLMEIPSVGKGIAEKIEEYLKTGRIRKYDEVKKRLPIDVDSLKGVAGLGPKKMLALYRKLGIRNLQDLQKAAKGGKIRNLRGFGQKTEQSILKGIEFAQPAKRQLLGKALPLAEEIEKRLQALPYVEKAVVAGSIRRRKETVGDADFLVVSSEPQKVMDFFVKMPEVARVYGKGTTKTMVRLEGMDADLRVVPAASFGAALNYFTGSKEHNVALRTIAMAKGMKLNEYGLFRGEKFAGGKDEEEIYRLLGLQYIPPEMRENTGEIELARKGRLPDPVGYGDLEGDLQVQTTWTDGKNSIGEMALAAKAAGLSYIAITDHTKALAFVGGLGEKKLEKQGKEIDAVNRKLQGIAILKGAEVNIMEDGSLDIGTTP